MAGNDRLDGKVVLITGAACGVGAATARAAVDAGASVALLDVDADRLASLAGQLGDAADAQAADITDYGALEAAVARAEEHLGRIDAVVANAGLEVLEWTRQMDPAVFRRVVEVNLVGTWNTVRATLEAVSRRRGYYLLVSSLSAVSTGPMNAAYNASKAGIVAMAKTLRLELAASGVSVGLAYLTYADTEMARRSVEDPRMQRILRNVRGASLKPMPVESVAQRYVRAIARSETKLLFDRSSRLVVAMPELAEAMLNRMMRGAVATAQREDASGARPD